MKNKKIVLVSLIIILIVVAGIIYHKKYNQKVNQEEAYIKIYIGRNVGITALYVPESCYEINESGKVKYIENVDEKEFDILGKIKKSKLKELEEMVMNAPTAETLIGEKLEEYLISNNGKNYYYIEVLNIDRYKTTNQAGEEIISFIKENTKPTLLLLLIIVGIAGVLVYLIYTKIVKNKKLKKSEHPKEKLQ